MSSTAVLWLLAYLFFVFKGLARPALIVCAYILTFYNAPNLWWWGRDGLLATTNRWSLYTGIIMILGIFLNSHKARSLLGTDKFVLLLLALYTLNCTLVHFLLADYPLISYGEWDLLWKTMLVAILFRFAIHNAEDLNWIIATSVICCGYIGYEIVINDAGKSIRGRLEGIDFPGASGSNGASSIMSMVFPFIAYLVICKPFKYARLIGVLCAPLVLDSVLRFNSRGAFLGVIISGLILLLMARGKSRRDALIAVFFGVLAFLYQAQDPKIWDRLLSINVSEAERDAAATGRIDSWKAGIQMIVDYPMGSGGRAAFASPRGNRYSSAALGRDDYRSVHNGYISIAAGWGVQGFALVTLAFLIAMGRTWLAIKYFQQMGNERMVFLGAAILSAFFGQATTAMFGDYYDGEWFIWLSIYGLVYSTFERTEQERLTDEPEAREWEIEDQDDPPIEGEWDSPVDSEVEFQVRR
jgi:O-antigen ligase